jgi:hypothetical protein
VVFALIAAATVLVPRARATAPPFSLRSTGIEAGAHGPADFTLAGYRGHPVVLDLMAVSCESCRAVTDQVLRPLWRDHHGKGLEIVSIDTWADPAVPQWQPGLETPATLATLQRSTGVPWRHALDSDRVWQKYDAVALPRIVVVDREGKIAYDHVGVPDLAAVEAAVSPLLGA